MGTFRNLLKGIAFSFLTVASLYTGKVAAGDYPTKIYFSSSRDGTTQIYRMNPDGTNQEQITTGLDNKVVPKLSHDGKRVLFTSDATGHWNIYTIDKEGKNQKNLTNSLSFDADGAWSPDDKNIIFSSYRQNGAPMSLAAHLIIMNSNTGAIITELSTTSRLNSEYRPSYSPDGNTIIFDSDEDTAYGISVCTKNLEGTNRINLTKNKSWNGVASYSYDGSKIVFVSNREGRNKIYVANADGSNPVRVGDTLLDTSYYDDWPCWAPDEYRIAFTSFRDSNQNIYAINADGSDLQRLTDNPAGDGYPSWGIDPGPYNSVLPAIKKESPTTSVNQNTIYDILGRKQNYVQNKLPHGAYIAVNDVGKTKAIKRINLR